jgi:hypothetical protein
MRSKLFIATGLILCAGLWLEAVNNNTTSLLPLLIPGSIPSANQQGSTGTKLFLCTGAFTSGHLVATDSNGNCVDSGGSSPGTLFVSTAPATITNTGSTLIGTGVGSLTIPANYFAAGTILHVFISGFYATAVTPGSLQVAVTLGGTNVIGAGAITPVGSVNNAPWSLDTYLVCQSAGSSGTIGGQGLGIFTNSTNNSVAVAPLGNNATTFNTTGTLVLNITASWGSFASGDSITGVNTVIGQL